MLNINTAKKIILAVILCFTSAFIYAENLSASEETSDKVDYWYTPDESGCTYTTSKRFLCNDGKWSEWNKPCPENKCSENQCWNGNSCEGRPAAPVCLKDIANIAKDDIWGLIRVTGKQCLSWKCEDGKGFVCMRYKEMEKGYVGDGSLFFAANNIYCDGSGLTVHPYDECEGLNWWQKMFRDCPGWVNTGLSKKDYCPVYISSSRYYTYIQGQLACAKYFGLEVKEFCGVYYMEPSLTWKLYDKLPEDSRPFKWVIDKCKSSNYTLQEKDGPISIKI